NRVVSRDRLVAELFPEQSVNSADHALRNHVSRLRRVFAPVGSDEPRVAARSPGYLLRVEPGELDLERFEQLVAEGHEALGAGHTVAAAALLRSAEQLWEGRPFADLEFEPFGRLEVERLEELRLAAVEERIDAELALGRQLALVPELETLAAEHPYREHFRAQLMLALYQSGRQAEGLAVFQQTRTLLSDELGLEPGTELQELQRAILVQDAALSPAAVDDGHGPAAFRDICPFKGLAPFEPADAEFFFGRERLVDELLGRLEEAPFLALVGASGSGKSSLLRAGLLPALDRDHVLVRPGDPQPFAGTASAFAVDQFEELFAAEVAEEQRVEFVTALVETAWDPERRALVIIALRADFFVQLARYPELTDLVGPNHVLLGPMSTSELRRTIEGPSERVGLEVEPELVDTLVDDVAGELGALPLLSTALVDLWEERDGRTLTLAAYARSGGVRGAVARHAEAAFRSLDVEGQKVARRLLLRLVGGEEALTRRRASRAELDADEDEGVSHVLAVLTERRLLVADGDSVELIHEALLQHWPRLRSWLEEDAQGRLMHLHLAQAAAEWEASGREHGELYRGARLAATVEWAESVGAGTLNRLEGEFLDESRRTSARANRRLRMLLAAALVLLVGALAAGGVALAARSSADRQATSASAERLGAQAQIQPPLDLSLLLAREAVNLDDTLATRGYLLAALLRAPAAIAIAHEGGGSVYDEALSPDGRTLAVRGDDGDIVLFDARTMNRSGGVPLGDNQISFFGIPGPRHALAYSPDGKTLAVGSTDGHNAVVELVPRGASSARVTVSSPNATVPDLTFSPDGRTLATGEMRSGAENPRREIIVLRNARTGAAERSSPPIVSGRLVGYTSDGRYLLVTTGDRTSELLDARTLERVKRFRLGEPAALAPHASLAAFGHTDGSVTFLDLATGQETTPPDRTGSNVDSLTFSADGKTLATGDDDGSIGIWDVHAGALSDVYRGHTAEANAVTFSPDGQTLYSGSYDGSVIAWDVSGARRLGRPFPIAPNSDDSSFQSDLSRDGSRFATSPGPNEVELWSSATRTVVRRLHAPIGDTHGMRFNSDGTLLGVAGDKHAAIWNVRTRKVVQLLSVGSGLTAGSNAVAFSPGSRVVAVADSDAIRLYDLRTSHLVSELRGPDGTPQDLDFSPDGTLLASATLSGVADLWNATTGDFLASLPNGSSGTYDSTVRFSPDGRTLAVGDTAGNVEIWDVAKRRLVGGPLAGQNVSVDNVEFDPSGRMLVTMSSDGSLRLWDVATQKLIGAPIPVSTGDGTAAFFPDGTHVLGDFGSTGVVWNIDPAAWEAHACLTAHRELTRQEWKDFLGQRRYRPVCEATH
ncbi:MAG TPA: BTAD domain-containing putative transcriptional regulator, partial [Gaiellaceae bacterium]|nr:BTAD domain-containing putative transcriptional regulator [Gaiellaceae bacterium]